MLMISSIHLIQWRKVWVWVSGGFCYLNEKDRQMILIDCLITSFEFSHFKDIVGSERFTYWDDKAL